MVLISLCYANPWDPYIHVNVTNSIGIAGSNFTVYGENFVSNYQNQSYCDWDAYGSYAAQVLNSTILLCVIPESANATVTTLRIANVINTTNATYTIYSNPISISIERPNNILMLAYIVPYQPVAGQPIEVVLYQGNFTSSNISDNLCKFDNETTYAYRENSTTAYCYTPYTSNESQRVSVSANGGLTWSNSILFYYQQLTIYSMYPTSGCANTTLFLSGVFPNTTNQYMCMFENYQNYSCNATVYGNLTTNNTLSCVVPQLNYSSFYRVYVSQDYGYHWTLIISSFFHYTPVSPHNQIPVLNSTNVIDFNQYDNLIQGYYFTPFTSCKLITDYDCPPYNCSLSMNVTFINTVQIYVQAFTSNVSHILSYGIVCTNDGYTYSVPRNVTFVPQLYAITPDFIPSDEVGTIYGLGFSVAGGQTPCCMFSFGDYATSRFLSVRSSAIVKFFAPYCDFTGTVFVTCSNDGVHFSSSSVSFSYGKEHKSGFPWPIILLFILILVCGFFVFRIIRRRFQKRNDTVNPLQTTQIELDNSDDNTNTNNVGSQVYQPVEQVEQVYGYSINSQPVQYTQNPQFQIYQPQNSIPQNFIFTPVLPQLTNNQNINPNKQN